MSTPADRTAPPQEKEPSWVRDAVTRAYFETEWQRVPRTQQAMFEHLCLLIFQNGLWWSLVLGKRETFNRHFAGFDLQRVAGLTDRQISDMLTDPGMIRNEAKIRCCIRNARLLVDQGISLPLIFEQAFPQPLAVETVGALPRTLEASDLVAGALKEAGLQRTGQVVCCSLAQATGFVYLTDSALPGKRPR